MLEGENDVAIALQFGEGVQRIGLREEEVGRYFRGGEISEDNRG